MPELVESIERINSALFRDFGRATDGNPIWRVVWSEDPIEQRIVTHTEEGFEYVNPRIEERKKYQHIKERYVLEQYVPVVGETDLLTKLSYEPAWTFEDRFGNYLPPRLDACQFVIEAVRNAMQNAGAFKKYKDPNEDEEARHKKILQMEEILFGNETPVTDALAYGSGVQGFIPKSNKIEEKSDG